ncbi:MAG: bacillithiol biosynthesis deacetylase BshB1 [Flavobacteriales bacterium]|nr:bacillithiol biosynthesis deacetylase BshB1 [Flavobacteriales bacterium]MCX7768162.1 bacillithiol biosynthesis deacetylase BshB1 [Flavobacteriales bacterium]MDW8409114.1 bacillithiol biosynthesis deacetylase BshB1 [Flavobacteriales bacterium]
MGSIHVLYGQIEKVDILAFGAHPDDVELGCGGLLAQEIRKGRRAAICDLTAGEAGTRGSPEIRREESRLAARILGLSCRIQLNFKDGFLLYKEDYLKELIEVIRLFRPRIVLANAVQDRHPDHGHAAKLVRDAAFLAGLPKIATQSPAHRPQLVWHYIQFYEFSPQVYYSLEPASWEVKMQAVRAHSSQFYNPESPEPQTLISRPEFLEFIEARGRQYGLRCDSVYAEGFLVERAPAVWALENVK